MDWELQAKHEKDIISRVKALQFCTLEMRNNYKFNLKLK